VSTSEEYAPTLEDKLRLGQFLTDSRDALGEIISRLDQLAPSPALVRGETPTRDQLSLQRAWDEFNRNESILRAVSQLRSTEDTERLDQLLADHGLSGAQLEFKLSLFYRHLDRFHSAIAEFDAAPPNAGQPRRERLRSLVRRFWRRPASEPKDEPGSPPESVH
jgi:hypothetical protein